MIIKDLEIIILLGRVLMFRTIYAFKKKLTSVIKEITNYQTICCLLKHQISNIFLREG